MALRIQRYLLAVSACLILCSCAQEGPPRKDTSPVIGQVYVDNEPAAQLSVTCHDAKGIDAAQPTISSAMTDKDGKFSISTYESGDGVPAGEYALTFMWGQMNLLAGSYGGPDKLNSRYTDPQKSEIRFTVESGKPTDLGEIRLTTK